MAFFFSFPTREEDFEKSTPYLFSRFPEVGTRVLCEFYLFSGRFEEALEQADKTCLLAEQIGRKLARVMALELKLRILLKLEKPTEVVPISDEIQGIAEENGYLPLIWRIRASKAQALAMLGDNGKSAEEYESASEVIRKLADTIPQDDIKQIFLSDQSVSSVLEQSQGS